MCCNIQAIRRTFGILAFISRRMRSVLSHLLPVKLKFKPSPMDAWRERSPCERIDPVYGAFFAWTFRSRRVVEQTAAAQAGEGEEVSAVVQQQCSVGMSGLRM